MQVRYGPAGQSPLYDCTLNEAATTSNTIVCDTLRGDGFEYVFTVYAPGDRVEGTDRYSYPLSLVVFDCVGCPVAGCPTTGGPLMQKSLVRIFSRHHFAGSCYSCSAAPRSRLADLHSASRHRLTNSHHRQRQSHISAAKIASFAPPAISAISCDQCTNDTPLTLASCPRTSDSATASALTITGSNFGAAGAVVFLGTGTYAAEHDAHNPHGVLTITPLPPGFGSGRALRVWQKNGQFSFEEATISYQRLLCRLLRGGDCLPLLQAG